MLTLGSLARCGDYMTVSTKQLARRISNKSDKLHLYQAEEAIRLLEEVILEELDYNEVVKIGSLFKLYLEDQPARQAYDGINKRTYTIPEKRKLKVKYLSNIDKLENK